MYVCRLVFFILVQYTFILVFIVNFSIVYFDPGKFMFCLGGLQTYMVCKLLLYYMN